MSITSIRQISNKIAAARVSVISLESGVEVSLTPDGTAGSVAGTDIWIPWCASEKDYYPWRHYIAIQAFDAVTGWPRGEEFHIWQYQEQVCVSTDNWWSSDAPGTRPDAFTGGDRRLVILGDATTGVSAIEIHAHW